MTELELQLFKFADNMLSVVVPQTKSYSAHGKQMCLFGSTQQNPHKNGGKNMTHHNHNDFCFYHKIVVTVEAVSGRTLKYICEICEPGLHV